MLVKTETLGWVRTDVAFEERWAAKSGNCTVIPMNGNWKSIGIQVSGGLDSAMLMYLTAKTIAKHGLKVRILPISFDIPNKIKNLASARAVISTIGEVLGFDQIDDPIELSIPHEKCIPPFKDAFINDVIVSIMDRGLVDFEFNGNTRNPPEAFRSKFMNDEHRQLDRDNRTTIYNGARSASPHAFMNKQDIVDLYRQHNLIDRLASLTLSCDENADIIEREKLPIPCGKCWWCREREWGFEVLHD